MINNVGIRTLVLSGVFFAGSFLGTVATRSQTTKPSLPPEPSPIAQWLDLDVNTAQAIHDLDPNFTEDLAVLRRNLDDARLALAALFEKESATDGEFRQQAEATIEAHNRLERRVTNHLIAVRRHLTPSQQKKLFSLCAEGVRNCRQRQWRYRGGRGGSQAEDDGLQRGRGGGRGSGAGHGRGRGRGQGRPRDPRQQDP